MIRKLALALLAVALHTAEGQTNGVLPDSEIRAFYREHAAEYAKERTAMVPARRRVSRRGRVLQLLLSNGEIKAFVDTLAEGDNHHRYLYAGYLKSQGLHLIAQQFYEGGSYLVIHDLTGQTEVLPGRPVLAPDDRHFAAASMDLEAGYDPNRIEVWAVDSRRVRKEFVLDGKDAWGPESVIWRSPLVLSFVRTSINQGTGETHRVQRWIVRSGGRWQLRTRAP